MKIVPIALSGGSGKRLWPLSRPAKPKQFLRFGSERSLLQSTLLRCASAVFDKRPIIVSSREQRFLVAEELREIGVAADILLEPAQRDSCAAVAAGCLQAMKRGGDPIVLVTAADHHVSDTVAFAAAVNAALPDAQAGYLVAFGIAPQNPETGFGYAKPGRQLRPGGSAKLQKFVEKPDKKTARAFIKQGYLWNTGNFLFRAASLLAELQNHAPEVLAAVKAAFAASSDDLDFIHLGASQFLASPSVSVDRAVFEKSEMAAIYEICYQWCDLGTWAAIWNNAEKNAAGNALFGRTYVAAGNNNLVHSENQLTVVLGMNDAVVIATRDAVLVADRNQSAKLGELVKSLEMLGYPEAVDSLKVFRPWGNYESLDTGDGYQVKRIVIAAGGMLSLQKHRRRAEHWIVVQGVVKVTIDKVVTTLKANQSAYVPLGSVHRLENNSDAPVVMIEVQTGSYLGEDDIIRYEDRYHRSEIELSHMDNDMTAGQLVPETGG